MTRGEFVFRSCVWVVVAFLGAGLSAQEINLGDITGGGDGSGNAPAGNLGIDEATGLFVTAENGATITDTDGINPSPVIDSDYIDSVFIIGPPAVPGSDPFPQGITQSGVTYDFPLADGIGTGWNYILKDRSGGGTNPITAAGLTWTTGVGIHASAGITYDLTAIRGTHGDANVGCFRAIAGMDTCSSGDVNLYAIVSDDAGIMDATVLPGVLADQGATISLEIPGDALYLTLAVGSNGVDACDHGTFAEAKIFPGSCGAQTVTRLEVTPALVSFGVGGNVQLRVRAFDAQGYVFTVTPAAEGTTYSATPAGIVSVSADGLVTALANGSTQVTATNNGVSASATINVKDDILLGDITAGGDGSGNAPAGNIGIDPRNGLFVTAVNGNTLRETDVEGDGVSPSPTASDYIDGVFIIGPVVNPGTTTFPQAITQSGVEFDFAIADGIGTGWNHIMVNRDADGSLPITAGGLTSWATSIGIHASEGITYSLANLRRDFGADRVGCFSTVWGMDDAGGDVNLYAIVSNEADGILEARTFRATQNSGALIQMNLPPEADYLTLATGSNGADGSDHGAFAEPTIRRGSCALPPLASLTVTPKSKQLQPGQTVQLKVTGTLVTGFTVDLTSSSLGTTYSIDAVPAGSITVDAEGIVTGSTNGRAVVTVTNGALSDTTTVSVQNFIDLGAIAAGSNGKTEPPGGNIGVNADTGLFVQLRSNADVPEANGTNPQTVAGNANIDSVFIMDVGVGQAINSELVTYDFAVGDLAGGWEAILNGREPGGPDYLQMGNLGPYTSGVGIHAAQGITYKLATLRFAHGAANVRYFAAVLGDCSGAGLGGHVNTYAILSDSDGIISSAQVLDAIDEGEFVQLEIPTEAKYLTLATGAAGDGIGADHGCFGQAQIRATPVDVTNLQSLSVSPPITVLEPAGEVTLSLRGVLAVSEFVGAPAVLAASAATFASNDTAVATVDAAGVIAGVASGRTTVRVTVGATSTDVTVIVGPVLDLVDVTRGGDGTGTADPANTGLDPRNGLLVTTATNGAPGTIRETDPEADGENPSPTAAPFVESVFFIGPPADEISDPFEQAITVDGVTYDFPRADGIGTGYNFIYAGYGADALFPVTVGGSGFGSAGLGIHASTGITYDLNGLRDVHGAAAVGSFFAYWGTDACATADVNLYAILSSTADGVIAQETIPGALANTGAVVEIEIPANAEYLTLAVGSNGVDACDHGGFAHAVILPGGSGPTDPVFHRGDSNADGQLNITDGIYVLNYLFLGGPNPPCLEAANPNDDAQINITDGIYILNFLFLGGPAPAAPGEANCGPDPAASPTDLGCESYTKC